MYVPGSSHSSLIPRLETGPGMRLFPLLTYCKQRKLGKEEGSPQACRVTDLAYTMQV